MVGHVERTSDDRVAKQMLHWIPEERRKRARPCVTWIHVISKDTQKGRLSWQEALSLAADRRDRRNWIAQCARHWRTKVYSKARFLRFLSILCPKKGSHSMFDNNFGKCGPICVQRTKYSLERTKTVPQYSWWKKIATIQLNNAELLIMSVSQSMSAVLRQSV